MHKKLKTLIALSAIAMSAVSQAAPIAGQGTWETTLQSRDIDSDGVTDAFYDTSLNITWLANANANGLMNWAESVDWATSLVVGSFNDWRLPGTTDVGNDGCSYKSGGGGLDCGFIPNANSSEMAFLYYVTLGNLGSPNDQGSPNDGFWGLANTGNFVDMRQNVYWSGTQADSTSSWAFSNYFGYQAPYEISYRGRAFAVRDGDVAISAVPEPSTYAMMLIGFAALTVVSRRKSAR